MAGLSWLGGTFAGIMIVTAVYCASRLVLAAAQRRATERDVDAVHIVMGVAMAGMLVTRPGPLWDSAWAVVFGVATVWFGWRVARGYRLAGAGRAARAHHAPHLVMSAAMVFMCVAVPRSGSSLGSAGPGTAMGGAAGTARFPLLAAVLALFMIGYVMWVGDRLPALARVRSWVAVPDAAGAILAVVSLGAPVLQKAAGAGGWAEAGTLPHGDAAAGPTGGAGGVSLKAPISPRLAACCEIAMGITMGYMLILIV